jgi:hypothetical protein
MESVINEIPNPVTIDGQQPVTRLNLHFHCDAAGLNALYQDPLFHPPV